MPLSKMLNYRGTTTTGMRPTPSATKCRLERSTSVASEKWVRSVVGLPGGAESRSGSLPQVGGLGNAVASVDNVRRVV